MGEMKKFLQDILDNKFSKIKEKLDKIDIIKKKKKKEILKE